MRKRGETEGRKGEREKEEKRKRKGKVKREERGGEKKREERKRIFFLFDKQKRQKRRCVTDSDLYTKELRTIRWFSESDLSPSKVS